MKLLKKSALLMIPLVAVFGAASVSAEEAIPDVSASVYSETSEYSSSEIENEIGSEMNDEYAYDSEEVVELTSLQDVTDAVPADSLGGDVAWIQTMLAQLNYFNGAIDSTYGPVTRDAVTRFQSDHGLYPDGEAGPVTVAALQEQLYGSQEATDTDAQSETAQPEESQAASDDSVASIQRMLAQLGYFSGSFDGIYGPVTTDAVTRFQAAAGIYTDGIAGPVTLAALRAQLGQTPSGQTAQNENDASQNTDTASRTAADLSSLDDSVASIQRMLAQLGYFSGSFDGIYGPVTTDAVTRFQAAAGIYTDGIAGPVTLAALRAQLGQTPSVQTAQNENQASADAQNEAPQSTGTAADLSSLDDSVASIQRMLAQLGYFSGSFDGIYGPVTTDAVTRFQADAGIYTDGDAGPVTIAALRTQLGIQAPAQPDTSTASDTVLPTGITAGGTYVITNGAQSAVLDVDGSSVEDGANVMLNSVDGDYNQEWVLQSAGNGFYYLRNLHSWKVLELNDGNVTQGDAEGSDSQMWKIVSKDGGGFQIVNANGAYLDTSSGNVNGSGQNNADSQTWYLEEVNPGTAIDFKRDGMQTIGIRTFQVDQGNVTETSDYYNIQTDIDLESGGYWLSGGSNYSIGLKVMYVTRFLANAGYLDGSYYNYNRYDDTVTAAVAQFQSDHGIGADGIVGERTWTAMGYSQDDFYNLGAYTTDLKVPAYGSERSSYVEAMVNTAEEYAQAGTSYSDGASGRPGTYVDCSGLIFQCLYAAGINPDVSIIDHARVVYEYTSNNLGNDARMGVGVSSAERGDLVFYGNSNGINHVGIYAGNGMIYDSMPGSGVTYRSIYSGGNILRIVRVF